MQPTANLPVIGLDLAKTVFQLDIVDIVSGEIQRRQLKRAKLAEFFAKCQRSLVAMEACGTAHHWARVISSLGHQVGCCLPSTSRPSCYVTRPMPWTRKRSGWQLNSRTSSQCQLRRSASRLAWRCTACVASS